MKIYMVSLVFTYCNSSNSDIPGLDYVYFYNKPFVFSKLLAYVTNIRSGRQRLCI